MKEVSIWTDGSCLGNQEIVNSGGWAAILKYSEHVKEISGGERNTTNNRMELTAVIEALKSLKEKCIVHITLDSDYVRLGITGWINKWKKNGWMTAAKKPVINQDLWLILDELANQHICHWIWVKGHSDNPFNERCDVLAKEAANKLMEK